MTVPPSLSTVTAGSAIVLDSPHVPPASVVATAHKVNINVGLMGHVDAGKTSLARFISDVGSTAAFDRHPASQERGITLDLGFSRVTTSRGTITLVDCPGHGSLLRMVLGAASIIDAVILVIDATEGIQAQTAECLVLAELVTRRLLVALTKVDKLASQDDLERMIKGLRRALGETVFGQEKTISAFPVPIVPVSPQLPETRESFLEALGDFLFPSGDDGESSWAPQRTLVQGPTLVAIDHCFTIKGQGAILTGTILRGSLHPGDMVEIGVERIGSGEESAASPTDSSSGAGSKPRSRLIAASANLRRIKSLQIFKKSVERAQQGDRVGINLGSGLDTSGLERTLLATPGLLRASRILLLKDIHPIRHYKYAPCRSRGRLHLSILHQTTLVVVIFLRRTSSSGTDEEEYELVDELVKDRFGAEGEPEERLQALITAPMPMVATSGLMAIASKLDIDQGQRQRGGAGGRSGKICRLVFSATVDRLLREDQPRRIYRWRQRMGTIDRLIDEYRLIGADISGTLAGLRQFIGMECFIVRAGDGGGAKAKAPEWDATNEIGDSPNSLIVVARGIIESPFGTSGKFNVNLTMALPQGSKRQDYLVMVRYKKYS